MTVKVRIQRDMETSIAANKTAPAETALSTQLSSVLPPSVPVRSFSEVLATASTLSAPSTLPMPSTENSFLAALIDSAEEQKPELPAVPQILQAPAAPVAEEVPAPRPNPSALLRAWSWLNRKYSLSTTKQLRVAETISLGEKRFVAVVHVEGKKFLIGGGASGVSLLTQLGTAGEAAGVLQPVLGVGEGSE